MELKNRAAAILACQLADIPGLTSIPATVDLRVSRHSRYSFAFAVDSEHYGGVTVNTFRTALRAEGIPVGIRDLIACPDEALHADRTGPDCCASRLVSASVAPDACSRLLLLGEPAASGQLLDDLSELADVPRSLAKSHENRHKLHRIVVPQ